MYFLNLQFIFASAITADRGRYENNQRSHSADSIEGDAILLSLIVIVNYQRPINEYTFVFLVMFQNKN